MSVPRARASESASLEPKGRSMTSMARSLFRRAGRSVIDRLLHWPWARAPLQVVGRYVHHRASGDNDDDMTSNGEFELLERIGKLLAGRAAVVFDVGANLGDWTRSIHGHLAPESTIHAFEPVATIFAALQRNVAELPSAPRVELTNAALSDRDGHAEIWVYGGGASALHDRGQTAMREVAALREQVRLLSGDDFCRARAIERIAFLKVDVEGHEIAVLRGFERMLAEGRIEALQFEYGGTWIDARSWLKDAFELLGAHGYTLGKLHPGGVRWYPQYAPPLETFQYANYVATRPAWREPLSLR